MAYVSITVTEEQFESLNRPVNGEGGFQRLIERLREGLRYYAGVGWLCAMTSEDAHRVLLYSDQKYGHGTFQTILRLLAPTVRLAMGAGPHQMPAEYALELQA